MNPLHVVLLAPKMCCIFHQVGHKTSAKQDWL